MGGQVFHRSKNWNTVSPIVSLFADPNLLRFSRSSLNPGSPEAGGVVDCSSRAVADALAVMVRQSGGHLFAKYNAGTERMGISALSLLSVC